MVIRIRQLLDWQHLSPTQFADLIGVGRPVVSHILSERNKPSLEVVQRIIAAFPAVSLPWLLSGTGEMLAPGTPASLATPAGLAAPVSPKPTSLPPMPVASPATPPVATPLAGPVPSEIAPNPVVRRPLAAPMPGPVRFVAPKGPQSAPAMVDNTAIPTVPTTPAVAELPAALATDNTLPSAVYLPTTAPLPEAPPAAVSGPLLATQPAAVPAARPPMPEAARLPFLGEPGKAIRRIVIFYHDGSFADYQPED